MYQIKKFSLVIPTNKCDNIGERDKARSMDS